MSFVRLDIKLDIKKKIHNGGKNCSKMRPINHPIAGIESVREPNRLIWRWWIHNAQKVHDLELYYAHHRPAIFWTWWLSSIRGADTGAYIIAALFRRSQGDVPLSSLFPDVPTTLIKKYGILRGSRGTDPTKCRTGDIFLDFLIKSRLSRLKILRIITTVSWRLSKF